jgi:molecular chaperone HtpG
MKIPPFLESAYQSDHKLVSFVSSAVGKIDSHVMSNRMVFFPEYTDHGIKHFELTLQTTLDLANGPSRGLLTSIDAAALVVAVALHDFGMHLTRDGFESLVAQQSRWLGISQLDHTEWHTLWNDFYANATRFDGRKLRQLFGENYRPVRPLPPKGAPWEDFDYLLVGEFLRQYHHRLAHEIALYGFPAKDGNAIAICPVESEEQQFLADLAGLIARSHAMDLRPCLDYLESKYQNRINPRRIHAGFLAILLRIADYFQIQSARAPTERTDVVSFQSQLSDREWKVHQAVNDIHNTSSDPEAIVVNAKPKDVETFLRLRRWLEGLQDELDRSWAILGEVFGLQSHNSLNLLGLKIRRVKSNLDDVPSFAKTVPYVPAKIAFETANADLLKLLVAPLYSDDPGIGIRELFQNAVDAVREFDDVVLRYPALALAERYQQNADVVLKVELDDKNLPSEIIVTDRGIGMSAEIVRDYFLKAGASFRRSNAWRQKHEDDGHSRVLRTGRFGVGALAAFLLGDEIEVTTRHVFSNSDDGVTFRAKLDDEMISLERLACPVGTRIRIAVPERLREHVSEIVPHPGLRTLPYDSAAGHYFLRAPSLSRNFSNRPAIPPRGWLPQPEDGVSEKWRWFSNSSFEKVFWTYSAEYPRLSCNGIIIPAEEFHYLWRYIRTPNFSIFDKDGNLPVNLQRTGLQAPIPIVDELLKSVSEDVLAYALTEAPNTCESRWFDGEYEGFERRNYYASPFGPHQRDWPKWLVGRDGFVLNEPNLIAAFQPKLFLLVMGGNPDYRPWGEILRQSLPADALMGLYFPGLFNDTNPRIKGLLQSAMKGLFDFPDTKPIAYTAFVCHEMIEKVKRLSPGREVRKDLSRIEASKGNIHWKYWPASSGLSSSLIDVITSLPVDAQEPVIIYAIQIDSWETSQGCKILADHWMKILDTSLIPFDAERRRALEDRAAIQIGTLLRIRRESLLAKAKPKSKPLK